MFVPVRVDPVEQLCVPLTTTDHPHIPKVHFRCPLGGPGHEAYGTLLSLDVQDSSPQGVVEAADYLIR